MDIEATVKTYSLLAYIYECVELRNLFTYKNALVTM